MTAGVRPTSAVPSSVVEAVLALLEERHALGTPGSRLPGWVQQRLDRALPATAAELGCGLDEVAARLAADAPRLAALAEGLRVGETSFYRDAELWAALGTRPRGGRSGGPLAVLSAGCSTGEEAWTAAMVLAAAGEAFRVVGVDRSADALEQARGGRYPRLTARNLPAELRARFLEEAPDQALSVCAELRPRVSFVQRDLAQGPPPGRWDWVLLRNVLLYLGEAAGARVVERLVTALAPDGVLVVARAEVPRVRALGLRPVELGGGVTGFRA